MRPSIAIVILAGGEAQRLPQKLERRIDGVPLLLRVYQNMRGEHPIFISARETFSTNLDRELACPIVVDRWHGCGPLGGLATILGEIREDRVFVVAGDAPFVTHDVLETLRGAWRVGDEAVVPVHTGNVEPLAALYDRTALERAALRALRCGTYAIRAVVAQLATRYVALSPEYFVNVNTEADLERIGRRPIERNHVNFERSISAFARAKSVIPGGVNSSVRAFKAVGGNPVFMKSGAGATITDIDGHEFIDYVLSWGPLILGHSQPSVVKAIQAAAARGSSFGTPTEAESDLAELIVAMVPSVEKVRFTSSGTEATMNAVRLARGYTRRDKIVKCAGCYHGAADPFLIAAGSSALTLGVPNSPGVPKGTASDTIVVPYNDDEAMMQAFTKYGDQIAAVIVEPFVGNMGLVPPAPGYLQRVRDICTQFKALLIFDEVMTGFRVARGGAQERTGVMPDLTTLGKVIGGGLPVGAFGGRSEVMAYLTPDGPVFHAGTLSGNPLAMAAGIATLKQIRDDATLYERLGVLTSLLAEGLHAIFGKHEIHHVTESVGSMFGFFFTGGPVVDLESAMKADASLYARFFHAMLDRGIYLAPSQFEAGFVSSAHTTREIETTLAAADDALSEIRAIAR